MSRKSYNEGQAASSIIYGGQNDAPQPRRQQSSAPTIPVGATPAAAAGSAFPAQQLDDRQARFEVLRRDILERAERQKHVSAEDMFSQFDTHNHGVLSYVELQEGLEHVLKMRCRGNMFQDLVTVLDPERRYQITRQAFLREFSPAAFSSSSGPSQSNTPSHSSLTTSYGSNQRSGSDSAAWSSSANGQSAGPVGSVDPAGLDPLSATDRNAFYSKIVRRFDGVSLDEVRKSLEQFGDQYQPGIISSANIRRALGRYADDFPLQDMMAELYGRVEQSVPIDDVLRIIEEGLQHKKRHGKQIVPGAPGSPSVLQPSRSVPSTPKSSAGNVSGGVAQAARDLTGQLGFVRQQSRKADKSGEGFVPRHMFRMCLRKSGLAFDDTVMEDLLNFVTDGNGNVHYDSVESTIKQLAA
eukprot:ANDGO_05903.mRNA.1 hypothetical protein